MGDFGDPVSLGNAVREARPDVVVSTASVGGASGDKPPSPGTATRYAPCGRRLSITAAP